MRIVIDGTALAIKYPCGVKTYAINLISNLAAIDHKNTYFVLTAKKYKSNFKAKNFTFINIKSKVPFFKRLILFPRIINKLKPNVVHYLEPGISFFSNGRNTITTLHDTNLSQIYPSARTSLFSVLYSAFYRHTTYIKSRFIIVPSNFSKTKLMEINTKIDKNSVYVVKHGINSKLVNKKNDTVKLYKYLLAVGDGSPRKNIDVVIKAYDNLKGHLKKLNLLIVSSENIKNSILSKSYAAKAKNNSSIIIKTNVNPKQMNLLYRKSFCLIYPSLYEDFGLPILEAMANGCPVITSQFGAMRETADDSALLVNPKSHKSIINAILKLGNTKLRNKLIEKGYENAKQHSWVKTAKKTLEIYKKISLMGTIYEKNKS